MQQHQQGRAVVNFRAGRAQAKIRIEIN